MRQVLEIKMVVEISFLFGQCEFEERFTRCASAH